MWGHKTRPEGKSIASLLQAAGIDRTLAPPRRCGISKPEYGRRDPPPGSAPNGGSVKFAVVIPTRNEARTVAAVVAAADAGLAALGGGLIVNADSGSDDGTGAAFLATPTRARKRLLAIDGPPGKGRNLLAAWKLCLDEGIDAVVTLDGDMTTVQPWWIEAFVRPIAEGVAEFVTPSYLRNLYRVVATRNISRPFMYAWFGTHVQQPLSGNAAAGRPLLQRLAARAWTPTQLRYGVETALVSTVLADGRALRTARLDICRDNMGFGHRPSTVGDVLTATFEMVREFAPIRGPAGPVPATPGTFVEGSLPDTAWLERSIAAARDPSAPCRRNYARWAGDRRREIEAAFDVGQLDAATWFHVFARALVEARADGQARSAEQYADILTPLLSLRALTVWREIAAQPPEMIDAAMTAEVPALRNALEAALSAPHAAPEKLHRTGGRAAATY